MRLRLELVTSVCTRSEKKITTVLVGSFGSKPRVQSVFVGSTAKLACADSDGTTRAVRGDWFHTRLPTSKARRLAQRQRYYTINEAAYNDSGYYKCVGPSAQIVSDVQVIVGKTSSM